MGDVDSSDEKTLQWVGAITGAVGVCVMGYSVWHSTRSTSTEGEVEETPPVVAPDRWLYPGQSMLFLGDSIAEGIDAPLRGLVSQYGGSMASMIKRGSTASYWAPRVSENDSGYAATVLSLGSNDAALFDISKEGGAMDTLIATLSMRGNPVLWFPPPSFRTGALKPKQQEFVDMILARGVVPLELLGPQPSVAVDPMHLHLDPNGYRTMAAQIFDALTRS